MACPANVRCVWWRWVIAFASFVMYFLSLGPLFNYSLLLVSLLEEFKPSLALAGWLGSLATSWSGLASPLTGLLEQRRNRRVIVLMGVVINCAGLLLTSFVPTIGYAYLTYGTLVGVGANFMIHPSMSLLLDWFSRKTYSRASSIALMGSTSGMLVFSPIMTALITQYGWRNALRILSGGILVVGIAVGLLLTNPPTEDDDTSVQDQPQNVPEDQNHETENMVQMKEIHDGYIKVSDDEGQVSENDHSNAKENDDCSVSLHESQVNTSRGMIDMMKNLEPWLFSIGVMFSHLGWTFFNIHFASFMYELRFDSSQIAVVIVCLSSGELGGKLLLAVIGDRLPFLHVYLLAGSCLVGAVVLGLLTVAKTYLTMALIAAASGFTRSGVYGGMWPADAQLFYDTYGTNNVLVLSLIPTGLGILISAPLSGVLFDVTGNYTLSLLVIIAIFLCASVIYLSIPVRRRVQSRGSCCTPSPYPVHHT